MTINPKTVRKAAMQIKAINHVQRMRILNLLLQGKSQTVGAIAKMVKSTTTTVSKNLAILRHAELVGRVKVGARVFYSIAQARLHNDYFYIQHLAHEEN